MNNSGAATAATGWRQALHHRLWRPLRHSLHWRLVALFLLLALGTTVVFVGGTRQWFGAGWRELGRPLVADYVDRLAAEIGSPPSRARARAITQRLPVAVRIQGPVLQWDSHPQRHRKGPAGDRDDDRDGPQDARLRTLLVRHTADGHRIEFGIGSWPLGSAPDGMGWATLAALLLLTGGAYWRVRRMLKPLDDIRSGALRFGAGQFAQVIPVRRQDELGDLAGQVNTMALNLQRMIEGQRGLLLAISHELRSPLTRARLNAELVAEGPERDALLRDLAQMRDLIGDLLESERLAAGGAALKREPVDLVALVRQVVDEQFADRGITLSLAADLPPQWLDRARLQLLVRNLLDNALRHGGGGAIEVQLEAGPATLTLRVRDHGPGIDEAQRQQLAQPFFRPDAARSRDRGGVGLGLYLCRLVAQSHGGALHFEPANPGLAVCVVLPLATVPAGVSPPATG